MGTSSSNALEIHVFFSFLTKPHHLEQESNILHMHHHLHTEPIADITNWSQHYFPLTQMQPLNPSKEPLPSDHSWSRKVKPFLTSHKIFVGMSVMFWKWGPGKGWQRRQKRDLEGKLFVINKNIFVNYEMLGIVQGTAEVDRGNRGKKKPMKWERKPLNETYTFSHTIIINGARGYPETPVGMTTKSKWILFTPSIREAGPKNINSYSFVLISLPP